MALPGRYDLIGDDPDTGRGLYRGDSRSWAATLEDNVGTEEEPVWVAKNLTGWTFDAEIRATQDDTLVMSEIAVTATDAAAGEIQLDLTPTEARKLAGTTAFWDLELTRTSDGFVRTYLMGDVEIIKDVSRT